MENEEKRWSQHSSSAASELVNLCETRSLMQGDHCMSNFRAANGSVITVS